MTSGRTAGHQLVGGCRVGDVEHRAARQRRTVAGDHLVAQGVEVGHEVVADEAAPAGDQRPQRARYLVGRCHVGRW